MCVSAGPWEGKFAHTFSRVAAELNAITKPLLTDVRQQLQLLSLSQLMETGDYEEKFTSRSWGNIFQNMEKPPCLMAPVAVQLLQHALEKWAQYFALLD